MSVKVKDIAKKLNLSSSTVSLVLNNRPSRISAKTRLKILSMAGKLSYNKDVEIDIEDKINIKTIGILTPSLDKRYNLELIMNIVNELNDDMYTSFIIETGNNTDKVLNSLDNLMAKGVDGIIFVSVENDIDVLKTYFEIFSIPVVVFNKSFTDFNCNFIHIDYDNAILDINKRYKGYKIIQDSEQALKKNEKNIICLEDTEITKMLGIKSVNTNKQYISKKIVELLIKNIDDKNMKIKDIVIPANID